MAGHSQWANIKHRKGAQDAKRGKIFTRIIKELAVSAQESGADPETTRLRTAIHNAKGANMPKDTMELEELEMELIDGGLESLEQEGEVITLYTDFSNMQKQLENMDLETKSADLQRIPNNTKALDVDKSKSVLKLIDKIEEDDDVQHVFHNLEMTDELMTTIEAE